MVVGTRDDLQTWVQRRAEQDDRLYERYGKPLEADHKGEFVAISDDGRLILGSDSLTVATRAVEQFGSGTFALRMIGADAVGGWHRRP